MIWLRNIFMFIVNISSILIVITVGAVIANIYCLILPDNSLFFELFAYDSIWRTLLNSFFLGIVTAELLLSLFMSIVFNEGNNELYVIIQPTMTAIVYRLLFLLSDRSYNLSYIYMVAITHCSFYLIANLFVYIVRLRYSKK